MKNAIFNTCFILFNKMKVAIYGFPIIAVVATISFFFVLIRMGLYCEPSIANCSNSHDLGVSVSLLVIFGIISGITGLICLAGLVIKCYNQRHYGDYEQIY